MVDGRATELQDRLRLPGRPPPRTPPPPGTAATRSPRFDDAAAAERSGPRRHRVTQVDASATGLQRAGLRRRSSSRPRSTAAPVVAVELPRLVLHQQPRPGEPGRPAPRRPRFPRTVKPGWVSGGCAETHSDRGSYRSPAPGLQLDPREARPDRPGTSASTSDHDEDAGRGQLGSSRTLDGRRLVSTEVTVERDVAERCPSPPPSAATHCRGGTVEVRCGRRQQRPPGPSAPTAGSTRSRQRLPSPASSPRPLVGAGQVDAGHGAGDAPSRSGSGCALGRSSRTTTSTRVRRCGPAGASLSSGNSSTRATSTPGRSRGSTRSSPSAVQRPRDRPGRRTAPRACRSDRQHRVSSPVNSVRSRTRMPRLGVAVRRSCRRRAPRGRRAAASAGAGSARPAATGRPRSGAGAKPPRARDQTGRRRPPPRAPRPAAAVGAAGGHPDVPVAGHGVTT